MFDPNPLYMRLPASILAELALAGFRRTGEHNQRQSFFRKWDPSLEFGLQHIEIVENRPDDLVVLYESSMPSRLVARGLEPRRVIEADDLNRAVELAVERANEALEVFQLSGVAAVEDLAYAIA